MPLLPSPLRRARLPDLLGVGVRGVRVLRMSASPTSPTTLVIAGVPCRVIPLVGPSIYLALETLREATREDRDAIEAELARRYGVAVQPPRAPAEAAP